MTPALSSAHQAHTVPPPLPAGEKGAKGGQNKRRNYLPPMSNRGGSATDPGLTDRRQKVKKMPDAEYMTHELMDQMRDIKEGQEQARKESNAFMQGLFTLSEGLQTTINQSNTTNLGLHNRIQVLEKANEELSNEVKSLRMISDLIYADVKEIKAFENSQDQHQDLAIDFASVLVPKTVTHSQLQPAAQKVPK